MTTTFKLARYNDPEKGWEPLYRWCSKFGKIECFERGDREVAALLPTILLLKRHVKEEIPLRYGAPVYSGAVIRIRWFAAMHNLPEEKQEKLKSKTEAEKEEARQYREYILPLAGKLEAAVTELFRLARQYETDCGAIPDEEVGNKGKTYDAYKRGVESIGVWLRGFPRDLSAIEATSLSRPRSATDCPIPGPPSSRLRRVA